MDSGKAGLGGLFWVIYGACLDELLLDVTRKSM